MMMYMLQFFSTYIKYLKLKVHELELILGDLQEAENEATKIHVNVKMFSGHNNELQN